MDYYLQRNYPDLTQSEATLLTYSLLTFFFIIPNIAIITLIWRNGLYRNNFHFVILHWTIANIISLIALLSSKISEYYNESTRFGYFVNNASFFCDTNIRTIPVVFGMFFIFDTFIRSKVCARIIYTIWCIFVVTLIVGILLSIDESHLLYYVILMYALAILNIIAFAMLVIKSFAYCPFGSNEETYMLRSVIVAVYIIFSISQWTIELLFYPNPLSVDIILLNVLFYGNGLINLVLLVSYEKHIKEHFWLAIRSNVFPPKAESSSNKKIPELKI